MAHDFHHLNDRRSEHFEWPVPSKSRNIALRLLSLAALTTAPTVNGVDLSHHNDVRDFRAIKSAGYDFVILKASEGLTWVDPDFDRRWRMALDADLLVGAYHFFRSNIEGSAQAGNFLNTVEPLRAATNDRLIPPGIDVETADGVTISIRRTFLQSTLGCVEQEFRKPMNYSSPYMWSTLIGATDWAKNYWGWVAHWADLTFPSLPTGWDKTMLKIWQKGVTGRYPWVPPTVPGIYGNVDINVFFGTLDDLRSWIGLSNTLTLEQRVETLEAQVAGLTARVTRLEGG